MNRRAFIKNTGLVSTSLFIPGFVKAFREITEQTNGQILVVIQLSGGNDGLNTVIPYRNDVYYQNRPSIAIVEQQVLKLTDEMGFHPSLEGIRELYNQGWLSIINNVGYPNPDRSHFRSMDIWHTASNADEYWQSGWLGRYLDAQCNAGKPIYTAIEVDDTLSLAMKGENYNALAVAKPDAFYQAFRSLNTQKIPYDTTNENLNYLYKTLADTETAANYIYAQSKIYQSRENYPGTELGKHLKTIADLIISNTQSSVYYCEIGGFDTHIAQLGTQAQLLKQYNDAVYTFVMDLKNNNRLKDVTILTFSEFGRRVAQNASGGTDHGTANNVFIINGELKKAGIFNENPNLQKLDEGDLIHTVDFRSIYATILQKKLQISPEQILRRTFPTLTFF